MAHINEPDPNELITAFRAFQRGEGMTEQEQTAETILSLQEQTATMFLNLPEKNDLVFTASTKYVQLSFSVLILQSIIREWQDMKTLSDKAAKIMTSPCDCGHERRIHYGERGQGGCDDRLDAHPDFACTCNGYMPKER